MEDSSLKVSRARFAKLTFGDYLREGASPADRRILIGNWQYHFVFWQFDFLLEYCGPTFLRAIGATWLKAFPKRKILADMRAMPLPLCARWKNGMAMAFFPDFTYGPHRRRWNKAKAWLESRGYVFPHYDAMRLLGTAYWQYREDTEE